MGRVGSFKEFSSFRRILRAGLQFESNGTLGKF
jgi:hypothetical protein